MICKTCGSVIADTDDFCPKCGTKVQKTAYCAHCGAVLHEDAEFCHKCGTKVPRGVTPAAKKFAEDEYEPEEAYEDDEYEEDGEYEEEEYDEEEYDGEYEDDEYDDEDDDEYDDDSDGDEENLGTKIAVTVIIILAIAILLVGAFAAFLFFGGSGKKNGEGNTAVAEQQKDTAATEAGTSSETESTSDAGKNAAAVGTVKVVKAVNIRKAASKDGDLIRTAKVGETFEYTDIEKSWYHIILSDGTQAYVYGEYVEEVK